MDPFVPGCPSVGNYNTTPSSDSLETGTDSSNSVRSATQSSPARDSPRGARRCRKESYRHFRRVAGYRAIPKLVTALSLVTLRSTENPSLQTRRKQPKPSADLLCKAE